MSNELYYEDFAARQQFHSRRSYTVERDNALAFAKEYDPQSQHLDEEAAKNSLFGELVISGWQTAAITMRLKLETPLLNVANGLVGMGLESVRWPRPTMPGDTLRIVVTILDKRPSNSKPDKGIVKYKVETFNQRDELAMEMITAVIVPRRVPGV
ncbi:MAG: MaoC family dehydratase [Alphaproteobacteria bacterium]